MFFPLLVKKTVNVKNKNKEQERNTDGFVKIVRGQYLHQRTGISSFFGNFPSTMRKSFQNHEIKACDSKAKGCINERQYTDGTIATFLVLIPGKPVQKAQGTFPSVLSFIKPTFVVRWQLVTLEAGWTGRSYIGEIWFSF